MMNSQRTQDWSDRRGDGVSRARLLVLRALYALIVAGQLLFIWPALIAQLPAPAHYHGIVLVMLVVIRCPPARMFMSRCTL